MNKKIISLVACGMLATSSFAQLNVQLHYDLGHCMYGNQIDNRQHLTATVENFTADRWGSTISLLMLILETMSCVERMLRFPERFKPNRCQLLFM